MDIQKGDKIKYTYTVFDVQCVSDGIVASINEDGSVVIDRGDKELVIDKNNVLERYPREDEKEAEKEVVAPVGSTEEEHFNNTHAGISLRKKETEKQLFNKKINHLGDK